MTQLGFVLLLAATCHAVKVDRHGSPDRFVEQIENYRNGLWGQGCCDTCAPTCLQTKLLMDEVVKMYKAATQGSAREMQQATDSLHAEVYSWAPTLERLQKEYASIAELYQAAPGGMDRASTLALTKISDSSFDLADSDHSGTLSFNELQDYMHMAIELIGLFQLAQGFDAWK